MASWWVVSGKCPHCCFQLVLTSLIDRPAVLTRFSSVALFFALVLLTWTLAHWTWVFVTPRPSAEAASTSAPVLGKLLAEKAAAFNLFGGSPTGLGGDQAPVAAPSNIVVQGIYAARDGRSGFAVLVVDGRTLSALQGEEFMPGVVLHQAFADRVEIQRGGQIEVARMAATMAAAAQANVVAEPAGLRVEVNELGPRLYGFSRAQLLKSLRSADQLVLLGRFGRHPRGGLVLERSPAGGLPEKLGLRVGDVVTGINGKSLAGMGDMVRLYEQLVKSERVNVDVLRAGGKMNVNIRVKP